MIKYNLICKCGEKFESWFLNSAEYEMLKKKKVDNITFKVGQKGGMSMYGLGRFPVTLYKSQWLILLDATDKIKEFLKDHEHELK